MPVGLEDGYQRKAATDDEVQTWLDYHAEMAYQGLRDEGQLPQASGRVVIGGFGFPVEISFEEWIANETNWWSHYEDWAEQGPDGDA